MSQHCLHAMCCVPCLSRCCPGALLHALPVLVPPDAQSCGGGFPWARTRWQQQERSRHPEAASLGVIPAGCQELDSGSWHHSRTCCSLCRVARGHQRPGSHARAGPGPGRLQVHVGPFLWDGSDPGLLLSGTRGFVEPPALPAAKAGLSWCNVGIAMGQEHAGGSVWAGPRGPQLGPTSLGG